MTGTVERPKLALSRKQAIVTVIPIPTNGSLDRRRERYEPMSRAIAHVGYHKTATTWFQKRFYPAVKSHAYVPRREVQSIFLKPSAFHFDAFSAQETLSGMGDRLPPIICEEELSGGVHTGGMAGSLSKDAAGRIRAAMPDAEVVIFLRNQIEMAAALYMHYIREGGTHSPKRYFFPERYRKDVARHSFKYPVFSFDHLEYIGLVEHYESLFGKGRVHIFAYESFRTDPVPFVRMFAERLGLEVDWGKVDFEAENTGYGANAIRLARLLNRFTYRSVLDKRFCLNLLSNKFRSELPRMLNRSRLRGQRPTPERILGPELLGYLRERFVPTNRRLSERYGLVLSELGYPCG